MAGPADASGRAPGAAGQGPVQLSQAQRAELAQLPPNERAARLESILGHRPSPTELRSVNQSLQELQTPTDVNADKISATRQELRMLLKQRSAKVAHLRATGMQPSEIQKHPKIVQIDRQISDSRERLRVLTSSTGGDRVLGAGSSDRGSADGDETRGQD